MGIKEEHDEEEAESSASEGDISEEEDDIMDLEDIGKVIKKGKTREKSNVKTGDPKEMVTPMLRKSLTKQGYKIIGTHSGVCTTVFGPDTGSQCVFPFTFPGVTHQSCADWIYGGVNAGSKWCSTKVDADGVHVNGEGNYGFCGSQCDLSVDLVQ